MLNVDASLVYRSTDFEDPSDWVAFRDAEKDSIQNLMLDIVKSQSRLSKNVDRPVSHDLALGLGNLRIDRSHSSATPLVFVPSNPRSQYQSLLRICLDWDLEALQSLPEDQEVSLGILSTQHQLLLLECSTIWRVPDTFRVWTSLAALVERFEEGLVPAECVHEAVSLVSRVTEDNPVEAWPIPDVSLWVRCARSRLDTLLQRAGLRDTITRRNLCLVARIARALHDSQVGFSDSILRDAVADYRNAAVDADPSSSSMDRLSQEIRIQVQRIAIGLYESESRRLLAGSGTISNEYIEGMSRWMERDLKKLQRDFGEDFAP